jgi:ATP-dependent DNA helicase RecG
MDSEELKSLLKNLLALPTETEWVEFKLNNCHYEQIGQHISALSNSAALFKRQYSYIVWGVEDVSHSFVGTTFTPRQEKIGNEELENWLLYHLDPRLDFRIYDGMIEDKKVVVFEIPRAPNRPVRFRYEEFIRIGSYTKKLREYPEKERELWRIFDTTRFEDGIAVEGVTSIDVLNLIDYPNFFRLLNLPLPADRRQILDRLASEKVVIAKGDDLFEITNMGAILFASDLGKFDRLSGKGLRVIIYKGTGRTEIIREQIGGRGYAIGFEGAISFINNYLPQNEQIGQAFRGEVKLYPEIAIRELVANALIHQDFNLSGTCPRVEIFADRVEIINPGTPLIETNRFIDMPPRSRNESLTALMRRIGICEERGTGIDKVIQSAEAFQLPAPDFRVADEYLIAVLYAPRKFAQMDRSERTRACYQHACLLYVAGQRMTNTTLRKRLGIADKDYPMASVIISDTIQEELIKRSEGGSASNRHAKYLPFWA